MIYNKTIVEKKVNSYLFFILPAITFILFSCAKTMQAYKIPDKEVQPAAARIFILRPSPWLYGIKQEVYENNMIAGQIGARSYLAWDIKPGPVTLQGPWGFMKVDAQPGKTYYFKLQPKTFSGGQKAFLFTPISEGEGKAFLEKQNLKTPVVRVVS